jgi:hypothetical protein
MYKGIQTYVVLCLKPAIQYTVFEQVKRIMIKGKKSQKLSPAQSFFLGMVARTVATIVVFPYVRAKVVLQTRPHDDDKKESITTMLTEMYKEGGLAEWFQGLGPELTRGVLSAALMLMIKEQIGTLVDVALYGTQKLTNDQNVQH